MSDIVWREYTFKCNIGATNERHAEIRTSLDRRSAELSLAFSMILTPETPASSVYLDDLVVTDDEAAR